MFCYDCEFSAFQHCLKAMSLSCLQGQHVLMFRLVLTGTQLISVSAEWCLYVAVVTLVSWRTAPTIPPTGFPFLSLRPFSLHTSLIAWTRWWLHSVVVSMNTPQPWRRSVRVQRPLFCQRGSGNNTTNTTNLAERRSQSYLVRFSLSEHLIGFAQLKHRQLRQNSQKSAKRKYSNLCFSSCGVKCLLWKKTCQAAYFPVKTCLCVPPFIVSLYHNVFMHISVCRRGSSRSLFLFGCHQI